MLQNTFALSTIAAKFMSLAQVVKEAIWLHGFLDDLALMSYISC
jgi:hypothetical protein